METPKLFCYGYLLIEWPRHWPWWPFDRLIEVLHFTATTRVACRFLPRVLDMTSTLHPGRYTELATLLKSVGAYERSSSVSQVRVQGGRGPCPAPKVEIILSDLRFRERGLIFAEEPKDTTPYTMGSCPFEGMKGEFVGQHRRTHRLNCVEIGFTERAPYFSTECWRQNDDRKPSSGMIQFHQVS